MHESPLLLRGQLPGENQVVDVIVHNGTVHTIQEANPRQTPDLGSAKAYIAPTLFDIQVNGVGGVSLQGGTVQADDVTRITAYLAARGVSRWVPTLTTASLEAMEHGCRVIAAAMQEPHIARAVPGIHLEGPWISPEDGPRGAHPRAHVRPPNVADLDRLYAAANGKLLYVTLAPEQPGAEALIRAIVGKGVLVSLGHHAADAQDIARAVDAGARLSTHLGNGAAAMVHRHHNPIWPQLADDRLHASFIADLHHLPAPALKSMLRAKTPAHSVLVSDCVDLAGMPPGHYELFGAAVEMRADGKVCLSGTDLLAGSSLMLLQGVVNAVRHAGLRMEEALACASTIPAALLGLQTPGLIPAIGESADFMHFEIDETSGKPRLLTLFIDGSKIQPATF
jgi:N-acetylglucosamine-6-phosphate deacetylase